MERDAIRVVPIRSPLSRSWGKSRVVLALSYLPLIGCNSILGAGDYHVGSKNGASNAMDGSSPSSEGGTFDHGGTAGAAVVGTGGNAGAGAGGSGAGGTSNESAGGSQAGGNGNHGASGGAHGGAAGGGTGGSTGKGGTGSSEFGSCKDAACCSTLTQPTCCATSAVKAACSAFFQGAGGWNGSGTGCAADGYMGSFTWFCTAQGGGLTDFGGSSGGGAAGAAGAGSTATCADLTACCAKITDPNDKSACQSGETAAGGDETLCNTIYQTAKQLFCP